MGTVYASKGVPVTEHTQNAKLGAAYRQIRPTAVVWKVNDRTAMSRPDFVITDAGQSWFVEAKMIDNTLTEGQQQECLRLRVASRHRVLILWYERDGRCRITHDGAAGPQVWTTANVREAAAQIAAIILARAEA